MDSHSDPSIEVTIKGFQDVVESIRSEFTEPDDDWMGMVIMEHEEGMGMIPVLFSDDEEKWVFTNQIIPYLIDKLDPHTVCHVLSAWMVEGGKDDPIGVLRPSKDPRRKEVLIIAAITIDHYEFWSAPILRFPDKPPKLGPWRMWDDATTIRGEFFDPIREALLRKAEEEL